MKTIQMLGLLALAAPLAAQEPMMKRDSMRAGMMEPGMMEQGMMGGMMGPGMMMGMMAMQEMMGPMMQGMAFNPAHLLMRKEALALTPQQEARLTSLRDGAKGAHDAAAADAKTHMQAVAQSLAAAKPDTTAAKQHFQAAHAAMGNAHWAMLRAAAQAKPVLTDEQRGRVNGWVDAMQLHMSEMMRMREQQQREQQ